MVHDQWFSPLFIKIKLTSKIWPANTAASHSLPLLCALFARSSGSEWETAVFAGYPKFCFSTFFVSFHPVNFTALVVESYEAMEFLNMRKMNEIGDTKRGSRKKNIQRPISEASHAAVCVETSLFCRLYCNRMDGNNEQTIYDLKGIKMFISSIV